MSISEGSGWGRINDRQAWGPLALDLDRAFAKSRMNDYETILMQYVRERSWARATRTKGGAKSRWPDAIPVPWVAVRIAQEVGEHRTRISEAHTALVGSRMLIDTAHGMLINKNAHQWEYPPGHKREGEPRLDAAALAYARAAQPRLESPDHPDSETPEVSANPDTSVRQSGHSSKFPRPPIRTEVSANPDTAL
jgi:hypothetical protein